MGEHATNITADATSNNYKLVYNSCFVSVTFAYDYIDTHLLLTTSMRFFEPVATISWATTERQKPYTFCDQDLAEHVIRVA